MRAPRAKRPAAERIRARTRRVGECIEWQGYRDRNGYGRINFRGGAHWVHRVAWIEANGEIPAGQLVLHRCDNPPCVNPDHLFLGTHADNTRDKCAKGRQARMRNERAGMAKLTDAQVAEIRRRRAAGDTCKSIARDYGVHPAHVSRVARFLLRPVEEVARGAQA